MTFKAGDRVEVITKDEAVKGILLPSFKEGVMFIKLDSGYNIGVDKDKVIEVKKIGEGMKLNVFPSLDAKQDKSLPNVSVVSTGGTIAAKLDYNTGGVHFLVQPGQIFSLAPEIAKIVNINKIESPFLTSSEDMTADSWIEIAKTVAKLLNAGDDGVIVTHGTDFLHMTAAALAFMLRDLNKPVALTYSQRSIDRGSTDASLNLIWACHYAKSDIAEVALVGHGSTDDEFGLAIRGTKVRKMHTSRRDTFRPMNDVAIAKIFRDGKIEKIGAHKVRHDGKVEVNANFEKKIALIKYVPGQLPLLIDACVDAGIKGIVIELGGLGHVATGDSSNNWLPSIKRAVKEGVHVYGACQTLYGRLDLMVYTNGRRLLEAGLVPLSDMLPETAYVKLGCVLGNFSSPKDVKREMLTDYAGEFNERLDERMFEN